MLSFYFHYYFLYIYWRYFQKKKIGNDNTSRKIKFYNFSFTILVELAGKLTELKRQVEDIRRRRQSQEDKVAALENPMLKVIIEDYYFILSHVCGLLMVFCSHREFLHFGFLNID